MIQLCDTNSSCQSGRLRSGYFIRMLRSEALPQNTVVVFNRFVKRIESSRPQSSGSKGVTRNRRISCGGGLILHSRSGAAYMTFGLGENILLSPGEKCPLPERARKSRGINESPEAHDCKAFLYPSGMALQPQSHKGESRALSIEGGEKKYLSAITSPVRNAVHKAAMARHAFFTHTTSSQSLSFHTLCSA